MIRLGIPEILALLNGKSAKMILRSGVVGFEGEGFKPSILEGDC